MCYLLEMTTKLISYHIPSRTLEERFWEKVNKNGPIPAHAPELGPCWLWTGQLSSAGRPVMRRNTGGNNNKVSATRIALEIRDGASLPLDLFALHKCDNGICVRFDHLYAGTKKDNGRDMVNRGRNKWSPAVIGVRGEANWCSRFKNEQIIQMRQLHWEDGVSYAELGRMFKLNSGRVHDICNGRRWGHIKDGLPATTGQAVQPMTPKQEMLRCIAVLSILRNTLLRCAS